jgi:hypothetical protein
MAMIWRLSKVSFVVALKNLSRGATTATPLHGVQSRSDHVCFLPRTQGAWSKLLQEISLGSRRICTPKKVSYKHQEAAAKLLVAGSIHYAWRRFGRTGSALLVRDQQFKALFNCWDPAITDSLAQTREVILFHKAGICP